MLPFRCGQAKCDPKETVTNGRFRAGQFAAAMGGEPLSTQCHISRTTLAARRRRGVALHSQGGIVAASPNDVATANQIIVAYYAAWAAHDVARYRNLCTYDYLILDSGTMSDLQQD